MKKPPQPADEAGRLAALRRYEVLDTGPEPAFDDLTLLAAQICQVPTAMVSLVDESRQWFKSRIGLEAAETSRDIAFCAHAILHADAVMEVRDARLDPRFAGSPLVTADPHVRFYAGAPLVTAEGHALGALCVMDRSPRTLTPEQLAALRALGRHVVSQLELRRQARELAAQIAGRHHVEARLQEQLDRLAASEKTASQLLATAEKSRRALLSIVEDERIAGRKLRESEARFRELAENIEEVFWITDPAKNQLLYISPSYEKIWGRTCQSLHAAPRNWLDAIHPADRERVLQCMISKQAAGTYDEEYRIVRPDQTERWIRDRAFPVRDAGGTLHRIVGVAEDITEGKKLQEQFLRAQRMEAIGTLAGGIAHDLNNILAPIVMGTGLLKEHLTTPRDHELITMIEGSASRGTNVIRQLLTFSRGIAGERVSMQLRHLIGEMAAIVRETFPRDITLTENSARNLHLVVGDPTQIHQVIMNLCVNARDAMPDGGKLTLSVRNADFTAAEIEAHAPAQPGPYVAVSVTDTGHGIPPEIVGRIFDPFFTTKAPNKGTGLGLSTVLGIVRSHGGFVTVQSTPRGTTFTVHLPAAVDASGATLTPQTSVLPGGHGELILVVDDEEPIRRTTRLLLEGHGYRVVTANDGAEAVALFTAHRDQVRLILTDVMMPVMNGVNLVRAIHAINPHFKVLATSGLTDQASQAELAAVGIHGVLEKPCDAGKLLAAIHAQLHPATN